VLPKEKIRTSINSAVRGIALLFLSTVGAITFTAPSAVATTTVPGGACPASASVTGNNCFYIAANGSDSNNGTSESSPWLHAPGMPNCSANCATLQSSLGTFGNTPVNVGGVGLIFRGGDTWHFGNSSATPYTGGTWNIWWSGGGTQSSPTCVWETGEGNCFYIGVDTTWYNSSNCSSWCRPILSGDNPTSTSLVSSCSYQAGSNNQFIAMTNNNTGIILDSFEYTGMCSNDTGNVCGNNPGACGNYIAESGSCSSGCIGLEIKRNLYLHGWTTTTSIPTSNGSPITLMEGGGVQAWDRLVVDGSDSSESNNLITAQIAVYPGLYHVRDSIFRYATQIATGSIGCHDIHDNIWEHFANQYYTGGHDNGLECNSDYSGSGTANVFYNNIIRHFDPSWQSGGQVTLWFCPNTTPEYWFNNLEYDVVAGGTQWDIVGPPTYTGCPNTGKQYMFNNTIVDSLVPCNQTANNNTGGQYLYLFNNHSIGYGNSSAFAGSGCNGGAGSSTNVLLTDAQATSQGYTTGTGGTSNAGNNCANDLTTPCSPTSASNSTVGAGTNEQAYCTALASYTGEPAIGTDAANACIYSTADGCSYNSTSHTMSCPAQTANARPSGAWNAGAYEFNSQNPPPNPPSGLSAAVN
jgi:hypothetical protein